MSRTVIIGNSGAGKSTLALRLASEQTCAHLDLDTLAWQPGLPPQRRALADSAMDIDAFIDSHRAWVIEGCYADLIELVLPQCTQLIFLNPGVDACIEYCRARPWEPHKYSSKQEQDDNLGMLIEWVRGYESRQDEFSLARHRVLFDRFSGDKRELSSRLML